MQRAVLEVLDGLVIDQFLDSIQWDIVEALELVGDTEALKAVDEGSRSLLGGEVGHKSHVMCFLDVAGDDGAHIRLGDGIEVRVIRAERRGTHTNRTACKVHDSRLTRCSQEVEVRDHQ